MYKIIVSGLLMVFLSSCLKEKAASYDKECYGVDIDYTLDIQPLIHQSCATNLGPGTGCHDAWIFEYSSVAWRISNGDWDHRVLDLQDMPPLVNDFSINPLTNDELITFKCWIDAGYSD
jgi:hypothetical protein